MFLSQFLVVCWSLSLLTKTVLSCLYIVHPFCYHLPFFFFFSHSPLLLWEESYAGLGIHLLLYDLIQTITTMIMIPKLEMQFRSTDPCIFCGFKYMAFKTSTVENLWDLSWSIPPEGIRVWFCWVPELCPIWSCYKINSHQEISEDYLGNVNWDSKPKPRSYL